MAEAKPIAEVTHYFDKIGVAVFKLKKAIKVGDEVQIRGNKTDLTQKITSMQIDRAEVESAKPGDDIGVKVDEEVREGDKVYPVE
jgi:putative protease